MPVETQFTPLLIPYVVSAAVTLGLAGYAAHRHHTGAAPTGTTLAFVGITLSVSVWTVARTLELLFVSQALSRLWLGVLYVGYGGVTMSALFFGLAFTGRTRLLTRRTVAVLLVVPLLAVVVAATNHLHELLWVGEFTTKQGWWGDIVVYDREFQPLFYGYLAYTVTATLVGLGLVVQATLDSRRAYRRQQLALLTGAVAALTVGVLFALGRQPLVPDFLDPTPLGFAVMGLCFGYAIFRHQLLDIVPVGRDTVIWGMSEGYVVLDTDDRVVDLNPAAEDLFDIDASVIGTPIERAVPACTTAIAAHQHGSRVETDIELSEDGGRRVLTVTVSSLSGVDGPTGRLLLAQDVTERRRVQQRYRALIEHSRDLILVVDRDRTITYASPSVETITGVDPDHVVGRDAFELVHREDREGFEQLFERLLEEPGEKVRYEYRAPDAAGNWLYLEASAWNLLDNPFVEGIVVNAREITERKRRERELERTNEQLDEFASVISHDLRNPLNVARGRLELARETDDPDDHLEKVEGALDRMTAIIDDVLTLARKGQSIGETEPVDLETTANAAWGHVETGRATLVVAENATIDADRDRLLQLFENLFRNAVEHGSTSPRSYTRGDAVERGPPDGDSSQSTTAAGQSDDGGDPQNRPGSRTELADLTVTVGFDGRLYVEDNGQGIPEEKRAEVLEPGYTTSHAGTGFGLSIVTGIAEAHGWTVSVTESDAGGARFEFDGVDAIE